GHDLRQLASIEAGGGALFKRPGASTDPGRRCWVFLGGQRHRTLGLAERHPYLPMISAQTAGGEPMFRMQWESGANLLTARGAQARRGRHRLLDPRRARRGAAAHSWPVPQIRARRYTVGLLLG